MFLEQIVRWISSIVYYNRFTFRGYGYHTPLPVAPCGMEGSGSSSVAHKMYLFRIYGTQYSIKFYFIANSVPGRDTAISKRECYGIKRRWVMKLLHENEIDNDSTVCGTLRPRCLYCSLGAHVPTTGEQRRIRWWWCQVAISTVVEVYGH